MGVVGWPQLAAKLSPSCSLACPPPAGEGRMEEEQPGRPPLLKPSPYTQYSGSETNL